MHYLRSGSDSGVLDVRPIIVSDTAEWVGSTAPSYSVTSMSPRMKQTARGCLFSSNILLGVPVEWKLISMSISPLLRLAMLSTVRVADRNVPCQKCSASGPAAGRDADDDPYSH